MDDFLFFLWLVATFSNELWLIVMTLWAEVQLWKARKVRRDDRITDSASR